MKNYASIARLFLIFVILIIALTAFIGLYKNRAIREDYVNYSCLIVIALAGLSGGMTFGMLVSLIVIFSYTSFLIVNFLSLDMPITFNPEQGWWFFLFIFSSVIAGIAGNRLKFIVTIFREHKHEIYDLITTGRLSRLGNIHRFEVDLDDEVARSKRSNSTFPLMYIGLADSEDIKMKFGKQGQPKVMEQMGELILRITRDTDKKAKVDDSTYGLIFPETPPQNLQVIIKKVIGDLNKIKIEHKGDLVKYVPRLRIGASFFPDDGDSAVALKEKARGSMKEVSG